MKVLSVRQPFAKMLAEGIGGKNIENREWSTSFRGPLLIHASQTFEARAFDWIYARLTPKERLLLPREKQHYQFGGIIGVVKLVDVVTFSESPWFVGTYGWVFEQATPLPFMKLPGQRNLFDAPSWVVEQVKVEFLRKRTERESGGA